MAIQPIRPSRAGKQAATVSTNMASAPGVMTPESHVPTPSEIYKGMSATAVASRQGSAASALPPAPAERGPFDAQEVVDVVISPATELEAKAAVDAWPGEEVVETFIVSPAKTAPAPDAPSRERTAPPAVKVEEGLHGGADAAMRRQAEVRTAQASYPAEKLAPGALLRGPFDERAAPPERVQLAARREVPACEELVSAWFGEVRSGAPARHQRDFAEVIEEALPELVRRLEERR